MAQSGGGARAALQLDFSALKSAPDPDAAVYPAEVAGISIDVCGSRCCARSVPRPLCPELKVVMELFGQFVYLI